MIVTASTLTDELAVAEMARALHWLPDVWLEVRHMRRNSYLMFTLRPMDDFDRLDACAQRVERLRRSAIGARSECAA